MSVINNSVIQNFIFSNIKEKLEIVERSNLRSINSIDITAPIGKFTPTDKTFISSQEKENKSYERKQVDVDSSWIETISYIPALGIMIYTFDSLNTNFKLPVVVGLAGRKIPESFFNAAINAPSPGSFYLQNVAIRLPGAGQRPNPNSQFTGVILTDLVDGLGPINIENQKPDVTNIKQMINDIGFEVKKIDNLEIFKEEINRNVEILKLELQTEINKTARKNQNFKFMIEKFLNISIDKVVDKTSFTRTDFRRINNSEVVRNTLQKVDKVKALNRVSKNPKSIITLDNALNTIKSVSENFSKYVKDNKNTGQVVKTKARVSKRPKVRFIGRTISQTKRLKNFKDKYNAIQKLNSLSPTTGNLSFNQMMLAQKVIKYEVKNQLKNEITRRFNPLREKRLEGLKKQTTKTFLK